MSYCPAPGDQAALLVGNGYQFYTNLAQQTYSLAVGAAGNLSSFGVSPITFNASFDFDGLLKPFERPERPDIDQSGFVFNAPASPAAAPSFELGAVDLDAAPQFNEEAPTLRRIAQPDAPNIVDPGAAPTFRAPVLPDKPDFVLPALPTFETLNLPAVPQITLPTFSAALPTDNIVAPDGAFAFTPEEYVSALLDKTKATISRMQDGGTGLPAAIERALFERGRQRIDEETERAVQEVYDEFGTRNFSEPNGMLAARLERVRDQASGRAADLNRDLTIQAHNVEIENLRFAVQQGVAFEQAFASLALEQQRLLLAVAQNNRDTAIAVLNARIAVFNSKLQGYQTEAQVFEARVRAELAKAEVYRAQIDGERARGEINEQRVRLYSEQIRAVQTSAELYRTQVQAIQTEVETNQATIEGYRASVQAYSERYRAYAAEWDGYRASVEGERAYVEAYNTAVNAFANRVQVWDRQQNAKFERERLRLQQHDQTLRVWDGDLRKFLAGVQAESARIGAYAQGTNALATMYQADASVAQAESAATDRSFELGLRKEQAEVDVELRKGEIRIQENIQLLTLLARVREQLAQVTSQLAASTMSAVNYSASVGSSTGNSTSCSTSYNFSGEIGDA